MATKNAMDEAFEEFESIVGDSKSVRREMIDMLRKQLPKCEVSEYDKALMISAKMSVIKTLDDILKSNEDVSLRKLKMRLARKDSETNGMIGQTMVALLQSIRSSGELLNEGAGPKVDPKETVDKIEAIKKELPEKAAKELDITDGELEACSATPSSDTPNAAPPPEPKQEEE